MKMRSAAAIGLALAAVLQAGSVQASDVTVARQAGLLGHWANDCADSDPDTNMTYQISSDGRHVEVSQYEDGANALRQLRLLKAGLLFMRETDAVDGETETVIWLIQRHQMRVWRSVDSDGAKVTSNGIVLRTGERTPWLKRCMQPS
jgi:hypothetical protein